MRSNTFPKSSPPPRHHPRQKRRRNRNRRRNVCECQLSLSLSLMRGQDRRNTHLAHAPPSLPTCSRYTFPLSLSLWPLLLLHKPSAAAAALFRRRGRRGHLKCMEAPLPFHNCCGRRRRHPRRKERFTTLLRLFSNAPSKKNQKISIDIKLLLEHGESAPFSASPPPQCPPKSPLLLRCAAAVEEEEEAFIAEKKYKWGEEKKGLFSLLPIRSVIPPPLFHYSYDYDGEERHTHARLRKRKEGGFIHEMSVRKQSSSASRENSVHFWRRRTAR